MPPALVQALECFDGMQSTLDLRSELVRITGQIQVGELEKHLFDSLSEAGFLENDKYRELKGQREAEFAAELTREAVFAGRLIRKNARQLAELFHARIGRRQGSRSAQSPLPLLMRAPMGLGIPIAPHTNPCLPLTKRRDRTFVILGTSHYGAPDRFGLTRKPFITPFGEAQTNVALVNELENAAPDAVRMEDYCHASNTRSSSRSFFCSIFMARTCGSCRFCAGPL